MECFDWKKLRDFVIIAAVIFVVACLSFHWIVGGDMRPQHFTYQTSLLQDTVKREGLNDTIYVQQLMARTDSLANATRVISERYQDDVNLMIYKSTQWFTIWLGIMAIVAGAIAVNQFYNHRKAADDKKEMVESIDAYKKQTTADVKERIDSYQGIINEYVKTLVDAKYGMIPALEEKISGLHSKLQNTEREIKISTLVTCISTFPDPSMFTSKPEKKEHLRYYLKHLHDELRVFVGKFKEGVPSMTEINRLAVVLTSVKYVIVRSRLIFPAYHQNITYIHLCNAIDKPLKRIVNEGNGGKDLYDDLSSIVDTFSKMIRDISIDATAV